MRNADFVARFDGFLRQEILRIDDYPNLRLLCWNRDLRYMTREDTFKLYEGNWWMLDERCLEEHETTLIRELKEDFVRGFSMPEFTRTRHRLVWRVLESPNAPLLASTRCFSGGGTRIALEMYHRACGRRYQCSAD